MKVYLGDSVYADFDGYHIWLTTENGYGPSNRIALEPQVFEALVQYRKTLIEHLSSIPSGQREPFEEGTEFVSTITPAVSAKEGR